MELCRETEVLFVCFVSLNFLLRKNVFVLRVWLVKNEDQFGWSHVRSALSVGTFIGKRMCGSGYQFGLRIELVWS